MTALDLFAGARGWSLGARWAGVEDEGVELMPAANATAEAAGFKVVHHDVWTFPLHQLAQYVGQIASPPCQPFSKMGDGAGRKALNDVLGLLPLVEFCNLPALKRAAERLGDDRIALVLTPLWYALHAEDATRWLAWEQVPSVLPVWEACAELLRAEGWHVWTGYLYSEQYGTAQARKRAGLLASRDHAVGRPRPTHSLYHTREPARLDPGVKKWRSLADALGPLTEERIRVQVTRPESMASPDWDFDDLWNKPSPTVTSSALVPFRGDYRHRTRNDGFRITVQEAGMLQGFPANYPWRGKASEQATQAGNAVPPLLAQAIIQEVAYGIL